MPNPRTLAKARARHLLTGCLLLFVVACDDQPTKPPADATYEVLLQAPQGHLNGAALIELSGDGIAEVLPDGDQIYAEVHEGGARVLVIAETPGQLKFSVRLSQASTLPTGSVIEVSDEQDHLRPSLTGYAVAVQR